MTESLWQEYKILQNKIDRIADFRFRIKGWMVTIVIAISFGGYATGRLPYQAYLGLMLIVFMFYAFEQSQKAWHGAFVNRLLVIERQIAFVEADHRRREISVDIVRKMIAPKIGVTIAKQKSEIKNGQFGCLRHFMTDKPHQIFYFFTTLIVFFMGFLSYAYPQKPLINTFNGEKSTQQQDLSLKQFSDDKRHSILKGETVQTGLDSDKMPYVKTVLEPDNPPPIQKGKSEEGVVQNGNE
jgi:hypothetical protein